MSITDINALCDFVESTMINDYRSDFPVKNENIKSIISKEIPRYDISTYIKGIFSSNLIQYCHVNGVVLYTINILNHIRKTGLYLNNLTVHRIVLICLMLSSKMHEDINYLNIDWSLISGVTIKNINLMEKFIMELLNNDLHIIMTDRKILSIIKCIY
tara:strand:+ start:2796 stop:3269 length:474 start_codon:yes stop_codon:yes gene_type:complete